MKEPLSSLSDPTKSTYPSGFGSYSNSSSGNPSYSTKLRSFNQSSFPQTLTRTIAHKLLKLRCQKTSYFFRPNFASLSEITSKSKKMQLWKIVAKTSSRNFLPNLLRIMLRCCSKINVHSNWITLSLTNLFMTFGYLSISQNTDSLRKLEELSKIRNRIHDLNRFQIGKEPKQQ